MPVVQLLLKHRADLAATNIAGLTPLQLAERCKRADIVAVLADVEANGFSEPAAMPSKVPAPLLDRGGGGGGGGGVGGGAAGAGGGGGGAMTGGKTFEELMSIKVVYIGRPLTPNISIHIYIHIDEHQGHRYTGGP